MEIRPGTLGHYKLRDQAAAWELDEDLWPTPTAGNPNDREGPETFRARQERLRQKHYNSNGVGTPLSIAAKEWPTPQARDYRDGRSSDETMAQNARPLNEFVSHLGRHIPTTPTAGRESANGGPSSPPSWRTPVAQDGAQRPLMFPGPDGKGELTLVGQAEEWKDPRRPEAPEPEAYATPRAQDSYERSNRRTVVRAHQGEAQMTLTRQIRGPTGSPAKLNPLFVEWLMGFPIGWSDPLHSLAWTDSALSGTPSSPSRPPRP